MPELLENNRLGGQKLQRVVYTEADIRNRIEEMGAQISSTYDARDRLLLVGLLKGSFLFVADLVRAIDLPLQVDFLVGTCDSSMIRRRR
jgi:hypoxanthine phosphoribosyltransferase